MTSPHDPFSARFDSIEIDPARAPTKEAIEQAMAAIAPAEAPGFYLLDDACGRFAIDRGMGVITLKDEATLTRERGEVHGARLKVIEPSGASYEMELKLRITGHVPQMLGAEEFGFLAEMASDVNAQMSSAAPVVIKPAPQPTRITWTHYAAALAAAGKGELLRGRRAFIPTDLPQASHTQAIATLTLGEMLPEVGASAPWSL
jgi:hypothetical protein